jgi:hypothetical protein
VSPQKPRFYHLITLVGGGNGTGIINVRGIHKRHGGVSFLAVALSARKMVTPPMPRRKLI